MSAFGFDFAYKVRRLAVCLPVASSVFATPALAASYTYTQLGNPGGQITAEALDNQDRVVGYIFPSGSSYTIGIYWTNGSPTLVPNVGALDAIDNGVAAGRTGSINQPWNRKKYIIYKLGSKNAKNYRNTTPDQLLLVKGISSDNTVVAAAGANHVRTSQAIYLQGKSGLALEPPGYAGAAYPEMISDDGTVGGYFFNGGAYAPCFTYKNGAYTTFAPPDPYDEFCSVNAITSDGTIYGTYDSIYTHLSYGYELRNGNYTYYSYGTEGMLLVGVSAAGVIGGNHGVSIQGRGTEQAFVIINGTAYDIIVPGKSYSTLIAVNANGSLLLSTDFDTNYYVAQCPTGEVCTQ